ncbi:hypothetical protein JJD84_19955 [Pseudomonas fluorescens]|nr:hypothetical protein [Pseudomonas fluorescens]
MIFQLAIWVAKFISVMAFGLAATAHCLTEADSTRQLIQADAASWRGSIQALGLLITKEEGSVSSDVEDRFYLPTPAAPGRFLSSTNSGFGSNSDHDAR